MSDTDALGAPSSETVIGSTEPNPTPPTYASVSPRVGREEGEITCVVVVVATFNCKVEVVVDMVVDVVTVGSKVEEVCGCESAAATLPVTAVHPLLLAPPPGVWLKPIVEVVADPWDELCAEGRTITGSVVVVSLELP